MMLSFWSCCPQVHHADSTQMHVGHPADQLQPRQQHPDRRLRRRLHLALGPTALTRKNVSLKTREMVDFLSKNIFFIILTQEHWNKLTNVNIV